jgi:DtxR family Mn-dependent transcriptional regulator
VPTTATGALYLKTIYYLSADGQPVGTGVLAERVGVSAPSVSAMLRRLEEDGLVDRSSGRGVTLTPDGERIALAAVRRHRLLETFLNQVIGFPWDEVHTEAELLEPGASDRLMGRIEELLGHPTVDPHGDPIPPSDLEGHREAWPTALLHAAAGSRFCVQRVSDRDPEALRYLAEVGLQPGETCDVARLDPFDGPLWVHVDGVERALSRRLAAMVFGAVSGIDGIGRPST